MMDGVETGVFEALEEDESFTPPSLDKWVALKTSFEPPTDAFSLL